MDRYRIMADRKLNPGDPAFGARIRDKTVVIPDNLVTLLARHSLGDDAVTNASFLASFPTAVAAPLGLTPQAVIVSAKNLLLLLKDAGADIPVPATPVRRRSYGALPPGQFAHARDKTSS